MRAAIGPSRAVPPIWLTPRLCRGAPVHRWFVFPHSYGPPLVSWLVEKLEVPPGSVVLDPFCGAGTTLVEAQRLGLRAKGIDLLPLAVLTSRAKTRRPRRADVNAGRKAIMEAVRIAGSRTPPPPILDRAFGAESYGQLSAALGAADRSPARDCLRLAVLSTARRFSRLVADGGWLRRAQPELDLCAVPEVIEEALATIEEDLATMPGRSSAVRMADARRLPLPDASVQAVITSPPYPNRHDYTRVFAVELELGFGLGEAVKDLRYRALHSHPEARSAKWRLPYEEPNSLGAQIAEVALRHPDSRIPRMLSGYFRDLFEVLAELRRVLAPRGRAALVVGNAQYCGVAIAVDAHLAELAQQAGLVVEDIEVLRVRGNSAQQMEAYGRHPSRESVVVLRLP